MILKIVYKGSTSEQVLRYIAKKFFDVQRIAET